MPTYTAQKKMKLWDDFPLCLFFLLHLLFFSLNLWGIKRSWTKSSFSVCIVVGEVFLPFLFFCALLFWVNCDGERERERERERKKKKGSNDETFCDIAEENRKETREKIFWGGLWKNKYFILFSPNTLCNHEQSRERWRRSCWRKQNTPWIPWHVETFC